MSTSENHSSVLKSYDSRLSGADVDLKIAAISDTHFLHKKLTDDLKNTDANLLIHSGDAECIDRDTTNLFLSWLNQVAEFFSEGVLFTPGNHDTYFRGRRAEDFQNQVTSKVKIVINGEVRIGGLLFYLSPYSRLISPKHNAFTDLYEECLAETWAEIPEGVDVLVTHSPPFGILSKDYGSTSLETRVRTIKPMIHIFGHIHECRGSVNSGGITFVNACSIGAPGVLCLPIVITISGKQVSVENSGSSKLFTGGLVPSISLLLNNATGFVGSK